MGTPHRTDAFQNNSAGTCCGQYDGSPLLNGDFLRPVAHVKLYRQGQPDVVLGHFSTQWQPSSNSPPSHSLQTLYNLCIRDNHNRRLLSVMWCTQSAIYPHWVVRIQTKHMPLCRPFCLLVCITHGVCNLW